MPQSSPEPGAAVISPYAAANGFHDGVDVGTMIIIAVSSEGDYAAQTFGASLEGQGWWSTVTYTS